MLNLLIIEPDPLVSMDIAEAARRLRTTIGVSGVKSLGEAQDWMEAGGGVSHILIRKPESDQESETYRFIANSSGPDTTVILIGADTPPEGIGADTRLLCLSMPFTTDMLDATLRRAFAPESPPQLSAV